MGERVRVYRRAQGIGGIVPEQDEEDRAETTGTDARDYDVDHYVRILRDSFASRLERAFDQEGWATVFADPEQPSGPVSGGHAHQISRRHPEPVRITGWVHGVAFLAYVLMMVLALQGRGWTAGEWARTFAASLVPFGSFVSVD